MDRLDFSGFKVLEATPRISGSRLGVVVAIRRGPIVDFSDNPFGPQPAKVVASLTSQTIEAAWEARLPVLLVFENDDPGRPVIVDIVSDFPDPVASHETLPAAERVLPSSAAYRSAMTAVGAQLGRIVGVKADVILVELEDEIHEPLEAKTAIVLRNLKDPVVLVTAGDAAVIIGQLYPEICVETAGGDGADVTLKGTRITIEADVELVLKSGNCVLNLDARGKASTTADQIVSRARGANKVQGGSVQLN
jgi:hypothetical protein